MNDMEIYFARENLLWDLSINFLIILGVVIIVGFIGSCIYDKWKYDIKPKLQKRKKAK